MRCDGGTRQRARSYPRCRCALRGPAWSGPRPFSDDDGINPLCVFIVVNGRQVTPCNFARRRDAMDGERILRTELRVQLWTRIGAMKLAETPSSKIQTPNKHQPSNTKSRFDALRNIGNAPKQPRTRLSTIPIGAWGLELIWILDLGVWIFLLVLRKARFMGGYCPLAFAVGSLGRCRRRRKCARDAHPCASFAQFHERRASG
jgi:hypothetical protein